MNDKEKYQINSELIIPIVHSYKVGNKKFSIEYQVKIRIVDIEENSSGSQVDSDTQILGNLHNFAYPRIPYTAT